MAEDEALSAALEVIRVLDTLGVDYLISDSLASSFHGIPRSTHDADLLVDLSSDDVLPLVRAIESSFYVDEDRVREAVERRSSFNVIFLKTMFKVDIFVLPAGPLAREEMRRRKRVVLDDASGNTIDIASAEDTVLQKLAWYQKGGGVSEQQWKDLLGVLKVCGTRLDFSYLRRWAAHLGVEDPLAQALRDAGIRDIRL